MVRQATFVVPALAGIFEARFRLKAVLQTFAAKIYSLKEGNAKTRGRKVKIGFLASLRLGDFAFYFSCFPLSNPIRKNLGQSLPLNVERHGASRRHRQTMQKRDAGWRPCRS